MIVSGAVKVTTLDGKEHIIPVHRHGDAYRIMHEFGIERIRHMDKDGFIMWVPDPEDPFYTENETFVDRVAAFKHAQECGQIDKNEQVRELYTEDLW